MLPKPDVGCHKTGFTKTCRACVVEHNCQMWGMLEGVNPQDGSPMKTWGCVEALALMVALDANKKIYEMGAALESYRNETVRAVNAVTMQQAENAIAQVIHLTKPVEQKRLSDAQD